MEWMKQQGMESVHTDELGNVIWEYRPEQEKKVLYMAHPAVKNICVVKSNT